MKNTTTAGNRKEGRRRQTPLSKAVIAGALFAAAANQIALSSAFANHRAIFVEEPSLTLPSAGHIGEQKTGHYFLPSEAPAAAAANKEKKSAATVLLHSTLDDNSFVAATRHLKIHEAQDKIKKEQNRLFKTGKKKAASVLAHFTTEEEEDPFAAASLHLKRMYNEFLKKDYLNNLRIKTNQDKSSSPASVVAVFNPSLYISSKPSSITVSEFMHPGHDLSVKKSLIGDVVVDQAYSSMSFLSVPVKTFWHPFYATRIKKVIYRLDPPRPEISIVAIIGAVKEKKMSDVHGTTAIAALRLVKKNFLTEASRVEILREPSSKIDQPLAVVTRARLSSNGLTSGKTQPYKTKQATQSQQQDEEEKEDTKSKQSKKADDKKFIDANKNVESDIESQRELHEELTEYLVYARHADGRVFNSYLKDPSEQSPASGADFIVIRGEETIERGADGRKRHTVTTFVVKENLLKFRVAKKLKENSSKSKAFPKSGRQVAVIRRRVLIPSAANPDLHSLERLQIDVESNTDKALMFSVAMAIEELENDQNRVKNIHNALKSTAIGSATAVTAATAIAAGVFFGAGNKQEDSESQYQFLST